MTSEATLFEKSVPGWSSEKTISVLRTLAREVLLQPEVKWLIEIGTWEGRTAIPLAAACSEMGGKLLCIDPYAADSFEMKYRNGDPGYVNTLPKILTSFAITPTSPHERFSMRLHHCNLYQTVDLRIARSADVAYQLASDPNLPKIGLVFIDGDHSPSSCWLDLLMFSPLVAPGGYIIVHDAHTIGLPVRREVSLWYDKNNLEYKALADHVECPKNAIRPLDEEESMNTGATDAEVYVFQKA